MKNKYKSDNDVPHEKKKTKVTNLTKESQKSNFTIDTTIPPCQLKNPMKTPLISLKEKTNGSKNITNND